MLKRGVLFGIVFTLIILVVPGQIYLRRANAWDIFMEKNVESCLVLFQDGTVVVATLYMENATVIPPEALGGRIRDILVIIHNHLTLERWSEMDKRTNHWLRRKGYAGPILLRLGSGKVIKWEDK